jgi:hypothetical protein
MPDPKSGALPLGDTPLEKPNITNYNKQITNKSR